jgi:hypothetical protein
MKKKRLRITGIKIFLWVILVLLVIFFISCFSLTPQVPYSTKDIILYRMSGGSLFVVWIMGVLIELDIFHVKKNIPLVKSSKTTRHIAFWCILIVFSIILFSIFYSCTSEQFKKTEEDNIESSQSTQTENNEQSNADQEQKQIIEITYQVDTMFESYGYKINISNVVISGCEDSDEIEISFDAKLTNDSDQEMDFILPARLEKGQINDTDIVEEVTSRIKNSDDGEVSYLVAAHKQEDITHTIKCKLIGNKNISDFKDTDDIDFEIRYSASYSSYALSYVGDHITNKDKEESDVASEEQATYITSENPVLFENFDVIDCSGVDFTIDKLKVCADLNNPKSGYNFYYIVFEYSVKNNNSSETTWQIGKGNSNFYGTFIYDSYERYLGGNQVIKDEDITSEWVSGGSLTAGEKRTYSMTLIVNRKLNDPEDGLMLKTDSQMQVVLPVLINDDEYELTYTLN